MLDNKTNMLKVKLNNKQEFYLAFLSQYAIQALRVEEFEEDFVMSGFDITLIQEGLITNNPTETKHFHLNPFSPAINTRKIQNITATLDKKDTQRIEQYINNSTFYLTNDNKKLKKFNRNIGDIITLEGHDDKPLEIISINKQEKTCKAIPCQKIKTTYLNAIYLAMRKEKKTTAKWEDTSLIRTYISNIDEKLHIILRQGNNNKMFQQLNNTLEYVNNLTKTTT